MDKIGKDDNQNDTQYDTTTSRAASPWSLA